MVGSELGRWDSTAAAVWANLVVVAPPVGDDLPGLGQRGEPVLIEALVPELAVEAVDVAVLHGFARLDQQVLDAMSLCPGNKGPAGELGAVVGPHGPWVAAKAGGLVEHPDHVGPANAVVDRDIHALVGEVIGHGQALEPSSVCPGIAHEVHAPDLIGCLGDRQRLPFKRWPLHLLAPAHGEAGLAVEPVHLLVVHVGKLRAQQVVQAAITEPAPDLGQFDDPGRQRLRGRRWLGRVTEGIAGQPRKAAGPALAQHGLVEHAADCRALALRG